jgi:hypothetical protein
MVLVRRIQIHSRTKSAHRIKFELSDKGPLQGNLTLNRSIATASEFAPFPRPFALLGFPFLLLLGAKQRITSPSGRAGPNRRTGFSFDLGKELSKSVRRC